MRAVENNVAPAGLMEHIADPLTPKWKAFIDGFVLEMGDAAAALAGGRGCELGKKAGASRRSGRKKDPTVQARNKRIVADFKKGLNVDAVVERYRISADLARHLKSEFSKTAKNRQS